MDARRVVTWNQALFAGFFLAGLFAVFWREYMSRQSNKGRNLNKVDGDR